MMLSRLSLPAPAAHLHPAAVLPAAPAALPAPAAIALLSKALSPQLNPD